MKKHYIIYSHIRLFVGASSPLNDDLIKNKIYINNISFYLKDVSVYILPDNKTDRM